MKLYTKPEFLKLPEGTLYCKGKPWHFHEICVKADSLGTDDFVSLSLNYIESFDCGEANSRLQEMLDAGASYPLQESFGRDGMFDKDDLFLVFERSDLDRLTEFVEAAKAVA